MSNTDPKRLGFEIELGTHLCNVPTKETADAEAGHAIVRARQERYGVQRQDSCVRANELDPAGMRCYLDRTHMEGLK